MWSLQWRIIIWPSFYREVETEAQNKHVSQKQLSSICYVFLALRLKKKIKVKPVPRGNLPCEARRFSVAWSWKGRSWGRLEFRTEVSKKLCRHINSKTEPRSSVPGPFSPNHTHLRWRSGWGLGARSRHSGARSAAPVPRPAPGPRVGTSGGGAQQSALTSPPGDALKCEHLCWLHSTVEKPGLSGWMMFLVPEVVSGSVQTSFICHLLLCLQEKIKVMYFVKIVK